LYPKSCIHILCRLSTRCRVSKSGRTHHAVTSDFATALAINGERADNPVSAWPQLCVLGDEIMMRSILVSVCVVLSMGGVSSRADVYYVNDGATNADAWCTEPGHDLNDGRSPATPKASVKTLVDGTDLEPGDYVRIDTGDYILTADIEVDATDGGTAGNPVVFEASPFGVTLDRQNPPIIGYTKAFMVWASDVTWRTASATGRVGVARHWARIVDAAYAFDIRGARCRLERLELVDHLNCGVSIMGEDVEVFNCLVYGTIDQRSNAISCQFAPRTRLFNNTFVHSGLRALVVNGSTELGDNIIVVSGEGNHAYGNYTHLHPGYPLSDRNIMCLRDGATFAYGISNQRTWDTLADWRAGADRDLNSVSADPGFADEPQFDYHLASRAGCYHDGIWTNTSFSSVGIDFGAGTVGDEPIPNATPVAPIGFGARNIGAFGGTDLGSKTPLERALVLVEPSYGENYPNQAEPLDIRWRWHGREWQSSDTLRIDYSRDAGISWLMIDGASAIGVTNQAYAWDISSLPASPACRVRVTCNADTNSQDESALNVRIGSNIVYFVNDTGTNNDAWCTAPGHDANGGLSAATPKASVQAILAAYDLGPGDTVRIDTGNYALTHDITVGEEDGGDSGGSVVFEGSPYGVVIDRDRVSNWDFSRAWAVEADHVTLRTANLPAVPGRPERWMEITDAGDGVWVHASNCELSRLCLHDNGTGAAVNGSQLAIANCLVCKNETGFRRVLGANISISNCTFHGNTMVAAHVFSVGEFRNNVVCADGAGVYALRGDPIASDNNLFFCSGGAGLATDGTHMYDTLAVWREETGLDANSLALDPQFVNAAGGDFHPQSTGGAYYDGAWSSDVVDSPCLDTGYGTVGDELPPNATPGHGAMGGRRNIGVYGGTEQASRTPGYRRLWLLEPVGEEKYLDQSSPSTVRWTWTGEGWNGGETATILYSDDSGDSWQPIEGGQAVPVVQGSFSWNTSALEPGPLYRIRVICNADGAVQIESGSDFRVGLGTTYYVNDTSTVNDAWCSAPGDDANRGLSPSTPKRSVQAVLDTYDLEARDRVRIDTGYYLLTAGIRVEVLDSGSPEHPVVFEASPYGVTIDRDDPAWISSAWRIDGSNITVCTGASTQHPGVATAWAKVTGAGTGIRSEGDGCRLTRLEAGDNNPTAINISGEDAVVENCLMHGAWDPHQGYGLYVEGFDAVISNCTIYGSGRYGILFVDSRRTTVRNTIVHALGGGSYCFYGIPGDSEYNCITVSDGAALREIAPGRVYATLAEWRAGTGLDTNSLSVDPVFVNPAAGDFHLQSTAGTYETGGWFTAAADSPCLDMGIGDAGEETVTNATPWHAFNRGRRNLGAYGGTELASRTPAVRRLMMVEPLGGELYANQLEPISVRWTWMGTGWLSSDTVKLRYSSDGGLTWSSIPGSSAVPIGAGHFEWDISSLQRGPLYRVEVSCNQTVPGTVVSSSSNFRIGEEVIYYVNDASTSSDLWCTAVGNDGRSGLSPSSPKATVQAILDAYDLEPGDTVRFDTGHYQLQSSIRMDASDGGGAGAPVVFEGSPYGVTLSYSNRSDVVWAATHHVEVRTAMDGSYPDRPQSWMRLTDGWVGLQGGLAARRLDCRGNSFSGFHGGATIENCIASGIYSSGDVTITNCTVFGTVELSHDLGRIFNTIIVADGAGTFAIEGKPQESDFNTIWVTNGAQVGKHSSETWPTLGAWRQAKGLDANSLAVAPRFVEGASGNVHLQSTAGAYAGITWTPSPFSSPCLDAGTGQVGDEPAPNVSALHTPPLGHRNQGAYGGTPLASKTPASRSLSIFEPAGGEAYTDQRVPVDIRWNWGGEDWSAGDTVSIAFSRDGGGTWTGIDGAAAVPVTNAVFIWDIEAVTPGPSFGVRVTCNQAPSAVASNAVVFRIGANIIYYVNDTGTTYDVWCTAAGDDDNDGLSPSSPKVTVQSVLDQYDLDPGDRVRIDTGSYLLDHNVTVGVHDSGDTSDYVYFEASPYGVLMDRGGSSGTRAWEVRADHIMILTATDSSKPGRPQSWMRVSGGGPAGSGVRLGGTGSRVSRIHVTGDATYGVQLGGADHIVDHCVIRGFANAGLDDQARDTQINNCTVYVEQGAGIRSILPGSVVNTVLYASGTEARAFNDTPGTSDYNAVFTTSGASVSDECPTLAHWRAATGHDEHSSTHDPLFLDLASDDFHLKSSSGTYRGGTWTNCSADSPCIDGGFGKTGSEPAPNTTPLHALHRGKRNIGAYGGTEQASKTPVGRCIWLIRPSGGENYLNQAEPASVTWTWSGSAWLPQDTCALHYSTDSGASWSPIPSADARAISSGVHVWTLDDLTPGPLYRAHIVCNQDGDAQDETSDDFRVGLGLVFYVNDTSTIADAWCAAPGGVANTGTSMSTPLQSVAEVLSRYDLEPGDTVRIDTGEYASNADIIVGAHDEGAPENPVVFEASPYGTVMHRTSPVLGSACWGLSGDYVVLRTAIASNPAQFTQPFMRLVGGHRGVVAGGNGARLERLFVTGNSQTAIIMGGENSAIENCVVDGGGVLDYGIWIGDFGITVSNCTVRGTDRDGVYISSSHEKPVLRHCIVHMDGADRHAVRGVPGSSDYNAFFATNGATVGYTDYTVHSNLSDWTAATGLDGNSIAADPLFVDAEGGDFHLRSLAGSYHSGAWMNDLAHSPAIDAGDPEEACEPEPEGDAFVPIANLGAYGSTEQASHSRDSDGDGASDNLEVLRLGTRVDVADSDGDGVPDGAEVVADTNPTNATSRLSITDITISDENIRIRWTAGRSARLLVQQTIQDPAASNRTWETVYIAEPPTVINEWLVTTPLVERAYYRLLVDW
jgi:hypothetical protein